MSQIEANHRELEKAFYRQIEVAKKVQKKPISVKYIPYYLLLFYAVECGLKALTKKDHDERGITQNRRKQQSPSKAQNSDDDPKAKKKSPGHDLIGLMSKIGVSKEGIRLPANLTIRLQRDKTVWELGKIHEAWRYGVMVVPEDEKIIVQWLWDICEYLEQQIPQRIGR